jgi:membrane associated rhomboid family serine protease
MLEVGSVGVPGDALVDVARAVLLANGYPEYLPRLLAGLLLLGGAVSFLLVRHLDEVRGEWGAHLRSRWVMGVPWGTVVTVAIVLSVYLFVQGGIVRWKNPVVLPFRAWTYLYPLGIVTSGFAHAGPGHLLGNLFGTIVLAPICEYAWGHFPDERGSESFASLGTNPWVRALVVFPAVVVALGLTTGLFAMGPVIGFSGVVFAFAGFGIVTRPITTLVGVLGVQRGLNLTYNALQQPIVTATPSASPPSAPWWAQIAIQGHAIGMLAGIILAVVVLYRRGAKPKASHIWLATLLFAIEQNLWAVYWFGDGDTFILFRGPGLVLVVLLAIVVTVGAASSLRQDGDADDDADDADDADGTDEDRGGAVSLPDSVLPSGGARGVALLVLLLTFAPLAGLGAATNAFAIDDTSPPADTTTVEVRDYDVYYVENVENEMVSIVDVEVAGLSSSVQTSGVVVSSGKRHIWTQELSKGQLAFLGTTHVSVGGPGWRERVRVTRRGWKAVGGGTTYHVWLKPPDGPHRLAFTADPATAAATIEGKNVSVAARDGAFVVLVSQNGTVTDAVAMPERGANATVAGITFERSGRNVYATTESGTRVLVFKKEQYREA